MGAARGSPARPRRLPLLSVLLLPLLGGTQTAIVFIKQPSSQDALQGRRALLRCEVEAPGPVHVYWLLDGAPVQDTERRFAQGSSLSFAAVDRLQDSGTFQCVARDDVTGEEARSANASFNIKWIEAGPVVLKHPASEAEIQPQTQVTLRCHIDGHPRPTYQWFRDGTPLSDGQSNHTVSSKERNLTLRPAGPEHSGLYSCCAHSAFGQACSSQNFTLSIADESFARVVLAPQDVVVARYEEAMFHCQFSAQPPPSLQWLFEDETPITNRSRPPHLRRATVFANGSLLLTQVRPRNAGIYRCIGQGQRGPPIILEATLHLAEIEDMPLFEPRVFTAGSEERVTCLPPKGLPEPSVWWEHAGVRLPTHGRVYQKGHELVLANIAESDAGVYTCHAANLAGQRRQDVNITVANGSSLPEWVTDNAGTLHFARVTRDDAGNYTCIASNGPQGQIRAHVQLTVAVFITFKVEPERTTVYQGHTALLQCEAQGDPKPLIQWKGKDRILDPTKLGPRMHIFQNGSLVIHDVAPEDSGRYTCIAGNSCNIKHTEAPLYVVDKPVPEESEGPGSPPPYKMIQTIGLSVGAAVAYIIAVLGLMFYCKKRCKAKRLQKQPEGEEPEMECLNGGPLQNGQPSAEIQEEVALTSLGSGPAATNKRHSTSDKMHFPRSSLQPITTLGKSEFGEVFLAKAQGLEEGVAETLVLVKSLQSKDEQQQLDFRRELEMFGKLNHANVVRLLGLCREAEPHYMVLEYVDLGDLKQFLRISKSKDEKLKSQPLSTKQKVALCTQVALGMEHLSNNRFVHKDLAARNCLVSAQRQVKVSALGLSKDVYNSEYYHFRQAWVPLRWMSPEAILEGDFSTKSDVWAFGVLMWEVFTHGEMPHGGQADDEVLADLQAGKARLPQPEGCPSKLYRLMQRCWALSPKDRPSFSEIASALGDSTVDSKP
ncbi:protein tyrosine kinase 7 (inactive) [Homo sapiens]|uniref:Isoform 3 of Inactive tyrosine-protein kinase 7 n=1 Tax=Homo sapiens TaxID=9606 RepID=Q13308-3|nr:inactive tyrosine-protein kinase 7 isoform c precursor [Homo sapiens]AAN04864.1 transmembrane receptor precursor PTK7-3 [Homo sapiens]EAX04158.1 PTK7 protein tyrosine kinase 7, isoform CRA_e [Homo sapiens]KAI4018381.1 protein tyrosine kinase 7 (inactive) [Homo sapiens]|eukprot:NP_690620.1 inactive tyrosine-protein kinase 7 isoform c precursor [Homo sapiens]